MSGKLRAADRWVMSLAIAAGLALLVIGIRFVVVPHQAARFFGLSSPPGPFDLHHVVAFRDLWLALLLIGLAVAREWRALSLCLGLGAIVCFADAALVAGSSGRGAAIAFHAGSGIFCGVVAWAAWLRVRPTD
jgi:hypothetical protein